MVYIFAGRKEWEGIKKRKTLREIEQIPRYNLTAKAYSNFKTVTRGIFKYAKRKKYIKYAVEEVLYDLDVSEVDFKKVIKEDCEEVFNEEEIPVIMEYLEQNPNMKNPAIILMFVTGIRVGEAVALKHGDFSEDAFKIRRTETGYYNVETKNYKCEVKEYPKTAAGVRIVVIPTDFTWLIEKIKLQNQKDIRHNPA